MRTMIRAAVMTAALCTGLPAIAAAQNAPMPMDAGSMLGGATWFISPFLGATFGGDLDHTSSAVGVAGGWKGKGRLGLEAELSDSPYLFGQNSFFTSRRVTTLMGNALVSLPGHGRVMPYAAGGLGLLHPRLTEAGGLASITERRWGYNVGGGVMLAGHEHVGARTDLRYFHGLRENDADATNVFGLDLSKFGFWRASVGLMVGF